ncbi:polyprenyl diphosphate synthase [uncultured Ezakiella sp.]|uniref:polyprenyl diphosphate synthase n=1 Tax=uncultured Ezakiella sp. TaxID=1637529 RepID=UPI0025FC2B63|nr:polyprenyl diphosphate synthase [uncultured Ezakiella sp.]
MHIAIIMDGNGRWATKRGLPRAFGHRKGMQKVIETIEWADKNDIKYLTLYAFSTENWKRPQNEVSFLMNLLIEYIDKELKNLHEKNAKVNIFGSLKELPEKCREKLEYAVDLTKDNSGLVVNFAINYSAWQDVIFATQKIVESGIDADKVDEELIRKNLFTAGMPDPDFILRTGGELRLSNFMLMQAAYSEFIFRDLYWPDITWDDLDSCLEEFNHRKRNFGGLK